MKASEIFEGENSSLRKTFDEAVANPERTVEEIRNKHLEGVVLMRRLFPTPNKNQKDLFDSFEKLINQISDEFEQPLQAERQKRDEMVEAERAKVMTIIEQRISETKKYFSEKAPHNCSLCWEDDYCPHEIEREALEDLKKALTQTNNPNV